MTYKKPKIILNENKRSFAGNDYLGFSRDPRLIEAMHQAALKYGISPTSGRWGLGWNQLFEDFEEQLKTYFATQDATFFGSAFMGGLIYFSALRPDHETVYYDDMCHLNLKKGMQAAGYTMRPYKHLDHHDLSKQLEQHTGKPPIIATDGLWGFSGEIPPLVEISALAHTYQAQLLIDDAHGVFGMGTLVP